MILKNLHLMTSWLPKLEKEFRSLNTVDDNFRLWLTSESHPNFPSTLIQICLKITNEVGSWLFGRSFMVIFSYTDSRSLISDSTRGEEEFGENVQ